MSPEIDLLERLSAEDLSLHDAAWGSCWPFRDLAHAQHVVSLYLQHRVVELYDEQADPTALIPFHRSRWILTEPANWERGSSYRLRLTSEGYSKFVEDSRSFFDDLFA